MGILEVSRDPSASNTAIFGGVNHFVLVGALPVFALHSEIRTSSQRSKLWTNRVVTYLTTLTSVTPHISNYFAVFLVDV